MKENTRKSIHEVHLPTRPKTAVTCPVCWTTQRSDRDICYQCGAQFIYRDETEKAGRHTDAKRAPQPEVIRP